MREIRWRRFRTAGGGDRVGRTCSEYQRREHERAFLDTTVLCTEGSCDQLGHRASVSEERERERRLTAGEMRGYRKVRESLADIVALFPAGKSSVCTGLSLPTTSRRVSVERERERRAHKNEKRRSKRAAFRRSSEVDAEARPSRRLCLAVTQPTPAALLLGPAV